MISDDQPLTDAELSRIREHLASDNVALHDAWLADDALHLLAEVDRLRAENDRLRKQVQDYHKSADEHTAKFERQHERLMEAQQEVRELRSLIHPQDSAPCARLHDTDPKSAHVVLNTVPMCFLSNEHEANHRCLCGKEW